MSVVAKMFHCQNTMSQWAGFPHTPHLCSWRNLNIFFHSDLWLIAKRKKKRSIYDQFNTPLPLLASSTRFGLKFGSLFSLPEGKLSWRTYSARISLLLRLLHLSCCFFIITPPSSNHQWPLGQIVRVNLPSRDTDSNKIPKEVLTKLKISLAYIYSSKKKNATMWCYEWSLSPVQCCFVFSLALS